jgi:hypothetical protein
VKIILDRRTINEGDWRRLGSIPRLPLGERRVGGSVQTAEHPDRAANPAWTNSLSSFVTKRNKMIPVWSLWLTPWVSRAWVVLHLYPLLEVRT